MPGPVVFISYSHDSDEHRERVFGLAARLRQDGLEARLDQEVDGTPQQGWSRWMLDQLDEASFVLVVCTETYYRRFRGHEEPGRGKGADWEGALITQEIYDRKSRTAKFVPVMLSVGQESHIPEPLRAHTRYELISEERYRALYAFLLGQAGVDLGPLGAIKPVSRRAAQPLAFGSPSPARPIMIGVPHRNPFFTGREELLSRLHQQLHAQGISALAQAAIYGLGGIGKTQSAIEYAHHFGEHYRFVLWVVAEEETAIRAAYLSIARELELVDSRADLETSVMAVKAWLSREDGWLLVFDNADDPALVRPYLPPARSGGKILLTSRAKSFVKVGIKEPFRVETLDPEHAVKFLIERTGNADAQAATELAAELGYLPLALEQAAAYIETVGGGFAEYLARYRRQGLTLLAKSKPSTDYPKTVATTWTLSFTSIREASPASAELLAAAAFLVPDFIPIEIFTLGGSEFGGLLAQALKGAAEDPLVFWELFEPLERYSLVERFSENAFKVHRLTQEVVKDSLGKRHRRMWVEKVVRALNAAYPETEFETWQLCSRLQPNVRLASKLTQAFRHKSAAAGRLFSHAGDFAFQRGDFADAKLYIELSLESLEHALGDEHTHTLAARRTLAYILHDLGYFTRARELLEQTLEIQERVLGPEHPDTLMSGSNLGLILQAPENLDIPRLSNLATARKLLERTTKIQERVLGGDHSETLLSKGYLAKLLYFLGDLVGARNLLEEILEIHEHKLGGGHPQTLQFRNNLAAILFDLQDYAGARELLQKTLEIEERILGSEHPSTTISAWNLLNILHRLNDQVAEVQLLEKLRWLLDRDEDSIPSVNQRSIRRLLLRFLNRS